ncbi:Uncharacterised protein [Mycobacteroides abscessus subsp. massiliense]|nr:Uncharacterised protein [Mycobacteroides abscessus subsp. massiliense]
MGFDGRHHHEGVECSGVHGCDAVADAVGGDVLADSGYCAGAVEAEGHGAPVDCFVQSHGVEYVGVVQTECARVYFDFVGSGLAPWRGDQLKAA